MGTLKYFDQTISTRQISHPRVLRALQLETQAHVRVPYGVRANCPYPNASLLKISVPNSASLGVSNHLDLAAVLDASTTKTYIGHQLNQETAGELLQIPYM
jgi:hypothetical protein